MYICRTKKNNMTNIKRKRNYKKVINKVKVYSTIWYNESLIKELLERHKSSQLPNFITLNY